MSKILDLDEVDTSQLSEGLEVKNYRALCELVGEEPKTGNGKNYCCQDVFIQIPGYGIFCFLDGYRTGESGGFL